MVRCAHSHFFRDLASYQKESKQQFSKNTYRGIEKQKISPVDACAATSNAAMNTASDSHR
jgi:hypothetical protein